MRRREEDVPCDEKCGISDGIGTDADMTLFDELGGLGRCVCVAERCTRRVRTALTVSAILLMHMNTARRRRQKAATVSLLSTSLSFACEVRTPVS